MKKAFLAWECPRCYASTFDFPATSRRDNKTEICSQCGVEEAMADFYGKADNWLDKAETRLSERP